MGCIAIIDDDEGLRRALAAFLGRPDREVKAFADGGAFLSVSGSLKVDVVILDLKMPGLSGLGVLERLQPSRLPVIMMSADGDVRSAVTAVKMGALDFIEKPFEPEALEALIETALDRAPASAGRSGDDGAVSAARNTPGEMRPGEDKLLGLLTPREREVALALNEGCTNKEIARKLDCSPRTVEVHRARVFRKLRVSNVAGLVRLFAAAGDAPPRDFL